jgi:hypothetical protein
MRKRIGKAKKKKREPQEPDVNQLMHSLGEKSVAEHDTKAEAMTKSTISQLMAEMGRKGGKIGGKRRLQTMTTEQRSQSALRAAQARWKKKPPTP